jgi:hypothetical protein
VGEHGVGVGERVVGLDGYRPLDAGDVEERAQVIGAEVPVDGSVVLGGQPRIAAVAEAPEVLVGVDPCRYPTSTWRGEPQRGETN